MYKVILHQSDGEKTEYTAKSLPYAKRYADLYKDDYPFIEIVRCTEDSETVIETFGQKTK